MSTETITTRVQHFYSRIPYPHVSLLTRVDAPEFHRGRLNHVLGRTAAGRLPRGMRIWVPGAGTTLGLQTALNFPDAQVLATDLSPASLAVTAALARQLGVTNLETRVENLLEAGYRRQFDYVDCAGVLNHVEDQARGWRVLARALKPGGVASIFIYNRAHRWLSHVWQDCLRLLTGDAAAFETRWRVATLLARDVGRCDALADVGEAIAGMDPTVAREDFADTLVHPHEVSYSLTEMYALVEQSGLSFAAWRRPDEWDPATYLTTPELRTRAAALSPMARESLVWRLAGRNSPYFEFYVEKRAVPRAATRPRRLPARLQSYGGVTYINVRRNRVHSTWHQPAVRRRGRVREVLLFEDSREKSGVWMRVPERFWRLLLSCDGSSSIASVMPRDTTVRAESHAFIRDLLAPSRGVLAPV